MALGSEWRGERMYARKWLIRSTCEVQTFPKTKRLLTHKLSTVEAFAHCEHRPLHGHFPNRSQALLTQVINLTHGRFLCLHFSFLSLQPNPFTLRFLQPHSLMGSQKEDCLGSVRFPNPPQQKNEASPSASRLLSEWTDPAARGLVIYSVCSVSGGHGARTRGTQEEKLKEWHMET